ncbi:MAG: sigma-70 family RNA polymerase sigma factor [Labilibaculum sp.]|nr:sigma factor-like helix-turn-helix DNA-binding protein [Labilibaculum sp.]MBI9060244.1 sigma-70 family RNA polymerase sigma factor [Labilibaculum sp.]
MKKWTIMVAINKNYGNLESQKGYSEPLGDELIVSLMSLYDLKTCQAALMSLWDLTDDNFQILLMRIFEGFTYEQIGDILDCSPLSAKDQYHEAKQALQKKFKLRCP